MSIERQTLNEALAALAADALAFWALMLMSAASLLLAGCASAPAQGYDPSKLSAEQLQALAADRSVVLSCGTLTTIYGHGVSLFLQVDKATIPTGGQISVDGSTCTTSVTLIPPASK